MNGNSSIASSRNLNINNLTIVNDNFIISNPKDKANLLAKYFADINNKKKKISRSSGLERIVVKTVEDFRVTNKIDNAQENPILKFNEHNKALAPKFNLDDNIFC